MLRLSREEVIDLFRHLGFSRANTWSDEYLKKKIAGFPGRVTVETADPPYRGMLRRVLENWDRIEIFDPEEEYGKITLPTIEQIRTWKRKELKTWLRSLPKPNRPKKSVLKTKKTRELRDLVYAYVKDRRARDRGISRDKSWRKRTKKSQPRDFDKYGLVKGSRNSIIVSLIDKRKLRWKNYEDIRKKSGCSPEKFRQAIFLLERRGTIRKRSIRQLKIVDEKEEDENK